MGMVQNWVPKYLDINHWYMLNRWYMDYKPLTKWDAHPCVVGSLGSPWVPGPIHPWIDIHTTATVVQGDLDPVSVLSICLGVGRFINKNDHIHDQSMSIML